MCEVHFFKPRPVPGLSSHTVRLSVECLFVLLAMAAQPFFPDKILEAGLHFTGVHLVPNGKQWLLMWTGLRLLAELSLIPEFHYLSPVSASHTLFGRTSRLYTISARFVSLGISPFLWRWPHGRSLAVMDYRPQSPQGPLGEREFQVAGSCLFKQKIRAEKHVKYPQPLPKPVPGHSYGEGSGRQPQMTSTCASPHCIWKMPPSL